MIVILLIFPTEQTPNNATSSERKFWKKYLRLYTIDVDVVRVLFQVNMMSTSSMVQKEPHNFTLPKLYAIYLKNLNCTPQNSVQIYLFFTSFPNCAETFFKKCPVRHWTTCQNFLTKIDFKMIS